MDLEARGLPYMWQCPAF